METCWWHSLALGFREAVDQLRDTYNEVERLRAEIAEARAAVMPAELVDMGTHWEMSCKSGEAIARWQNKPWIGPPNWNKP